MQKAIGRILLLFLVLGVAALVIIPPKKKEEVIENSPLNTPYDEYYDYIKEIRQSFAKQMYQDLGLICEGDRGMMHEKVEKVGLQFRAYRRATIEEARALHLHVLHGFIDAINQHEKLRPFLEEYPFDHKRTTISISFEGPKGCCTEGSLGCVSNAADTALDEYRNRLIYDTIDPFSGKIELMFSEPYEEAIELASAHPIENLAIHQTTSLEDAIDDHFPYFGGYISREYRIRPHRLAAKITDRIESVEGKFVVFKRSYQKDARKILLTLTERLLRMLNTKEQFKPHLAEFPFPPERLKLRIEFTKSNHCPYCDDSMESVVFDKGEISYFREYPSGTEEYYLASPLVATETYQEALNLEPSKRVVVWSRN